MEKKEKVVEKSNVEVCSPEIVNSVETLRMRLEEIGTKRICNIYARTGR